MSLNPSNFWLAAALCTLLLTQAIQAQGASVPSAVFGCQSPSAYLDASPDLATFSAMINSSGYETIFKDKNFTGTILAPTNSAFQNFTDANGVDLASTDLTDLVESLLQYHVLLENFDNEALRHMAGRVAHDTALALTPATNALLLRPADEVFTRDPALIYETLILYHYTNGPSLEVEYRDFHVDAANSTAQFIGFDPQPFNSCMGSVYRIDNLLLPRATLAALAGDGATSEDAYQKG